MQGRSSVPTAPPPGAIARRRFLRRVTLCAGAVMALALGTACQELQRSSSTRPVRPSPVADPDSARRGPSAPRDDTATILLPGDLESLEPPADSVLEQAVVSHLFDAHTRRDPRSLEIRAEFVQNWRTLDAHVWELTLPRGARFHDGSPADAEAVAFSLGRHARGQTGARPTPSAARIAETGWAREGAFAAAEVLSATALRVTTQRPVPLLPDFLADVPVLPPSQYFDGQRGSEEIARKPVGSGPYTLAEWSPAGVTMAAFEGYWGTKPNIRKIIVKSVDDPATRTIELLAGRADLVGGLPAEQIPIVERRGARVSRAVTGRTIAVAMRVDRPVLADRRARQALSYSFDVEALRKSSLNGAPRARSMVNPPWEPRGAAGYPYDPSRARALLAELGWTPGQNGNLTDADGRPLALTMDVPRGRGPRDQDIARALQQDLGRIGIRVELRSLEWPVYRGLVEAGNQDDLYLLAAEATFTAQQELQILSRDTTARATRWQNEEFARLFDELSVATEPRSRHDLVDRLWTIVQEDPPWIPICREVDLYGVGRRLAWEAPATQRVRLTDATLSD